MNRIIVDGVGRLLCLGLVMVASQCAIAIDVQPFVEQPQYENIVLSPSGDHLAMIVRVDDKDYPYKTELRVFSLRDKKVTTVLRFPRNLSVANAIWLNHERLLLAAEKKRGGKEEPVPDANLIALNFDGTKQLTIFGPDAGVGVGASTHTRANWANMEILQRRTSDPQRILIQKRPWRRHVDDEMKPVVTMLNFYNARQTEAETIDIKDAGLTIDLAGEVRFAERVTDEGFTELYYRVNADADWQMLYRRGNEEGGWQPLHFIEDGKQVLITDNSDSEWKGLALFDPVSGKRQPVFQPAGVDIGRLYWTADEQRIFAFTVLEQGKPRLKLVDPDAAEAAVLRLAAGQFPGRKLHFTSFSDDGQKAVVNVSADTQAPVFYLLDSAQKKVMQLAEAAPWLKGIALSPTEPVTITARDGLKLPAYLTVPKGASGKGLPTVVLVHGGPFGLRDSWGYDSEVQLLAAAGYAVLQVNFRGSGGYGKAFQFDAYGQWGTTMQDDLTDATRWLIKEGIADSNRICLMGHSYGGYATVWGLLREPDLYRCGVASMGVYDLALMHEEGDIQRSKWGRNYLEQAIGTDPDSLKARSPVHHVAALKVPLLLSHGAEDERVPIEHVERLIAALKKAEKSYEYLQLDGEAHGFANVANRRKFAETALAFLKRNIGN